MKHEGKVVMVTGAARGIGAAVALRFAQEGANVALLDILETGTVAAEIAATGRQVLERRCDVSDPDQVEEAVQATVSQFGRLDAYIANAAFSERGPFLEIPMELFRKTIDVSMWGVLYGLKSAAKAMIQQGQGGSFVVIGSPHAVIAVPGAMPYNMAKAAVDHMARTAAAELFEHRIRVNIVHPGWIDTPGERKFYSDEQIQQAAENLPWKRLGKPEEIAATVSFLVSDEAEYINGSTTTVDGGLRLATKK